VPGKPDGVYPNRVPAARLHRPRRCAKLNHVVKGNAGALDRTFAALADPTRRRIIAMLASGPHTVSTIAEPLPMSLVAVSKHISVLERAGVVTRTRVGRTQLCRLRADALRAAAIWLDSYRAFWTDQLDRLEHHLTTEQT
jgi:DNA-binding transcriptional ArsR family regulator